MKRKTDITVGALMTTAVITFKPTDTMQHVVETMRTQRISGAPVIDEQRRVIGIISEADIMKLTASVPFPVIDPLNPFPVFSITTYLREVKRIPEEITALFEGEVKDAMTRKPVTISPEASLAAAARLMHKHDFNRLPVVDADGKLIGIVARDDIIRVFAT
jgi:CBS domain-containing protein